MLPTIMIRLKKYNNRGQALVMVFIIMLIFAVIGTSLMVRWSYDTSQTKIDGKLLQAYYVARSGADALGTYIETNPDNLSNAALKNLVYALAPSTGVTTTSNSVTFRSGSTDSYILQVTRSSANASLINIVSTSTVGNVHQTVTLILQENANPTLNSDGTTSYTYSWSYNSWKFKTLTP